MYKKTFNSVGRFLKENWLFAIVVTLISYVSNSSTKLSQLFVVRDFIPFKSIILSLVLSFLLFPLALGAIKCFDMAKNDDKKNILFLFYFYTNIKRLVKALILGIITDTLILLLILLINNVMLSVWLNVLCTVLIILMKLYFFLSSYILVKKSELKISSIIKLSYKKIKCNINTLFFLNLIIGLTCYFLSMMFSSGVITIQQNILYYVIAFSTTFFENIIFYCFADLLLTEGCTYA